MSETTEMDPEFESEQQSETEEDEVVRPFELNHNKYYDYNNNKNTYDHNSNNR